jgi:hypothetical protein
MSKTPAAAAAAKPKPAAKPAEAEHEEPNFMRGTKPKKTVPLNDFEKHTGWHQICRKEKHKMIT